MRFGFVGETCRQANFFNTRAGASEAFGDRFDVPACLLVRLSREEVAY